MNSTVTGDSDPQSKVEHEEKQLIMTKSMSFSKIPTDKLAMHSNIELSGVGKVA